MAFTVILALDILELDFDLRFFDLVVVIVGYLKGSLKVGVESLTTIVRMSLTGETM
jgi:hypothetical protein